jgi:transcriptional regulator with XRE-family HTH domain
MSHNTPIPERLKEARSLVGMSQRELGIKAGIDEFSASPRINHYEKGRHLPDYTMMERMAEVLGVPVPYFYARDEEMAELILLLGRLSPGQRRNLARELKARE